MSIFKACDMRGVFPEEINQDNVLSIAKASGSLFEKKDVVVGGDVRISTERLKQTVIDGLLQTGCHVVDIGTVPTPVFHFALNHLKIVNGIMVTASHNPHNYNGLKIIMDDVPVIPEDVEAIKKCIENKQFHRKDGDVEEKNVMSHYTDFLDTRFKANGLSVVADVGNGAYSKVAGPILKEKAENTTILFDEPDGRFPNRSPNSALPENLIHLMGAVKEKRADLGFAFDGDGDRVSFVDETGAFVEHDRMIAFLCRYFLKSKPGSIFIYDQKCSDIVPATIEAYGGVPIAEKSGHSFIKRKMKERKGVMGGEISGHYFYQDLYGNDDGLFSALLLMEIMSEGSISLSTLLKDIPINFSTPDLRVRFDEIPFQQIEQKLTNKYPGCKITRLDGVKIHFDNGWALFRSSITEPAITVRFDAGNHHDLCYIVNDVLDNIPSLKAKIFTRYPNLLQSKDKTW